MKDEGFVPRAWNEVFILHTSSFRLLYLPPAPGRAGDGDGAEPVLVREGQLACVESQVAAGDVLVVVQIASLDVEREDSAGRRPVTAQAEIEPLIVRQVLAVQRPEHGRIAVHGDGCRRPAAVVRP